MPARCGGCEAELGRLPPAARFCPRCGATLAPAPTASIAADEYCQTNWEELASAWRHFRRSWARHRPGSPVRAVHSLITLGYANAMYKLGFRYETGCGAARNRREAVRCYSKAARLGNPWALLRLAPHDPSALDDQPDRKES